MLSTIRLHPKYDQAMNNLANILKDQNNLEEARLLLEKAVSIRLVRIRLGFYYIIHQF